MRVFTCSLAALLLSSTSAFSAVITNGFVFPDSKLFEGADIEENGNVGSKPINIGGISTVSSSGFPLSRTFPDGSITVNSIGTNTILRTTDQISVGAAAGEAFAAGVILGYQFSTGTLSVVGDGTAGSAQVISNGGINLGTFGKVTRPNGVGNFELSNGALASFKSVDPKDDPVRGGLRAATHEDIGGAGVDEATINISGSNTRLEADFVDLGNTSTGASATMTISDGAKVDVNTRIVETYDFDGISVDVPFDVGAFELNEGSDAIVRDSGSTLRTDELLVGTFGVFDPGIKSENAPATLSIINGGELLLASRSPETNLPTAVVGDGVKGTVIIDGAGSKFNHTDGSLFVGAVQQLSRFVTASGEQEAFAGDGKVFVSNGGALNANDIHVGSNRDVISGLSTSEPLPFSAGLLDVSSGGTVTADKIILYNGGTLTGAGGTIVSDVILDGGTISPGASPGILNIFGDLKILSGLLKIEIAGTTLGLYDQINVSDDLIADSGFDIEISFLDDFVPKAGDKFNFLNIAGAFPTLDPSLIGISILGGGSFGNNAFLDFSGGQFTLISDDKDIVPVPLPAGFPLLVGGMFLFGLVSRNRRTNA